MLQRGVNIILAVVLIAGLISCEENIIDLNPEPPYTETEKMIREEYDNYAVFRWKDYDSLLKVLSDDKFTVLPLNEMRKHFDNSKVVIGLRHDMDFNPFRGLEMAEMERSYGFRATYFILGTAKYNGLITSTTGLIRNPGMDSLYRRISKKGAEIGIHNDLLTVMIEYKLDPVTFNREEIDFYKSIGIRVKGTAAHGSPISKYTAPGYEIFSEFAKRDSVSYMGYRYPVGIASLYDFGYEYEAYYIDYNKQLYISDSGGKWNDPDGFNGILKKLSNAVPGDRIQILVHPDWWGKEF